MPTNYKQIFALKNKNKQKIKQLVPDIKDEPGIYILTRKREIHIHWQGSWRNWEKIWRENWYIGTKTQIPASRNRGED